MILCWTVNKAAMVWRNSTLFISDLKADKAQSFQLTVLLCPCQLWAFEIDVTYKKKERSNFDRPNRDVDGRTLLTSRLTLSKQSHKDRHSLRFTHLCASLIFYDLFSVRYKVDAKLYDKILLQRDNTCGKKGCGKCCNQNWLNRSLLHMFMLEKNNRLAKHYITTEVSIATKNVHT